MEQQENVVCPCCNQFSHVRRKLLTSPFCFEQPEGDMGHISVYTHSNGPGAASFLTATFVTSAQQAL
jgi:hypothetical protein